MDSIRISLDKRDFPCSRHLIISTTRSSTSRIGCITCPGKQITCHDTHTTNHHHSIVRIFIWLVKLIVGGNGTGNFSHQWNKDERHRRFAQENGVFAAIWPDAPVYLADTLANILCGTYPIIVCVCVCMCMCVCVCMCMCVCVYVCVCVTSDACLSLLCLSV